MVNTSFSQRDISLDLIRIIACLLVVLMHSPYPSESSNSYVYTGISYFSAPCIGLFFMISGATLLPAKQPLYPFLKKRLGKILWPTIFWTCFYLLIGNFENTDLSLILKKLLSIPFSAQGNGVLWFMYTLAGIYLLAPILSPWIKNSTNSELLLLLLLWFITLFFPLIRNNIFLREDTAGILYYFSGYIGYFVFGFYLKKRNKLNFNIFSLLIFYLLLLTSPIFSELWFNCGFSYDIFWYLGPFVMGMTTIIFITIGVKYSNKLNYFFARHHRLRKIISSLSSLSFAIYFIHIAIMRYILWDQIWFINIQNCIIQIIICFSITFISSWFISYLLSKLSFSKYIIGI